MNQTMYLEVEPLNPQSEEYKFSPQHVVMENSEDPVLGSGSGPTYSPSNSHSQGLPRLGGLFSLFTGRSSGSMYPKGPISSSKDLPKFSGKYAANDTWAYITRQLWEDYLANYAPYEEELINQTTYNSPGLAEEQVGKAKTAAAGGVDTAYRQSQQFRDRYGAALDPRQERISGRYKDLSRSASIADAANRVRMKLNDQNREIAFGLGATTQINPIYGQDNPANR